MGRAAMWFKHHSDYPAAAEAYAKQADLTLPDNELIYSDECLYAFELWIKAGEPAKALEQARRALHGYTIGGDWLKGDNPYIDRLTDAVGEFRKADYVDEADVFLSEVNAYLASIGEDPLIVSVVGKQHDFPADCPHCGAATSYHGTLTEIDCPFCGGILKAID